MQTSNRKFLSIVFLALSVLIGCTSRTVESSSLTPSNQRCRADLHEDLVKENASNLGAGRYRDLVVETLSDMAVAIWEEEPTSTEICQTRHVINSKPGQPIYDVEFQSQVTIFTDSARVCLNHVDAYGPDRNGIRVSDAEIKHPWKWVDQGRSVAGLPKSYFARREYLPVCFDKNGGIVEYLDG